VGDDAVNAEVRRCWNGCKSTLARLWASHECVQIRVFDRVDLQSIQHGAFVTASSFLFFGPESVSMHFVLVDLTFKTLPKCDDSI
jgi:hypothetical protein